MARVIYIVNAMVVDANGSYNPLGGYPKKFDSRSYDGDEEKTKKRAEGDFSEVWGAFCKRDDRQIQTVMLYDAKGSMLDRKSMGDFPEEPAQN